jgi:hypothetical protein
MGKVGVYGSVMAVSLRGVYGLTHEGIFLGLGFGRRLGRLWLVADIGKDIDNDLLQKMYKEDLSVSWPLDIPIEQFLEDMKMWEDLTRQETCCQPM